MILNTAAPDSFCMALQILSLGSVSYGCSMSRVNYEYMESKKTYLRRVINNGH